MLGVDARARHEAAGERVLELLRQGEHWALAGRLRQAESLFAQAWALAVEHESELADSAAWEVACLLLRMEAYGEAGEWFSRVTRQPAWASRLWPANVQAMVQICRRVAHVPPLQALPPLPIAFTEQPERASASAILPALFIRSFGCFQVFRAGTLLPVCRARKAIMLLRYLWHSSSAPRSAMR